MPAVASDGRGGLLDAIVDSDFADNHSLYFCFSELAVSGNANSTALARCALSADNTWLEDVKVIFSQNPKPSAPPMLAAASLKAVLRASTAALTESSF